MDIEFQQALKALPQAVTGYNKDVHSTVRDLCYLCLDELGIHADREFYHDSKFRKACLAYCERYGFFVEEARETFKKCLTITQEECYI
jgi:hypothetical protein